MFQNLGKNLKFANQLGRILFAIAGFNAVATFGLVLLNYIDK